MSVCLCPSVSMHSHSFQDTDAETLQVGRGRPGTGRGGVKNVGGAPVGAYTYFNFVKARATQLVYSQKDENITLASYQTTHRLLTLSSFIENSSNSSTNISFCTIVFRFHLTFCAQDHQMHRCCSFHVSLGNKGTFSVIAPRLWNSLPHTRILFGKNTTNFESDVILGLLWILQFSCPRVEKTGYKELCYPKQF